MNTLIFLDARKYRYSEEALASAARDYVAGDQGQKFFVFKKPEQSFPDEFSVLGIGHAEDYTWPDKICKMVSRISSEHSERTTAYVLSYTIKFCEWPSRFLLVQR